MTTTTPSWAWMGQGTWPGWSPLDADNLDASGNGLTVLPSSYAPIAWNDFAGDGVIDDADLDDGIGSSLDTVTVNGATRTVTEIARYDGSTVVINGVPHTVTLTVWLFSDGTWMVRLADPAIPPGVHYTAVDSITLGTWDGVEYTGSYVANRDDPFVCFAAGTRILTPRGEVAVERLRPGDPVLTRDHGLCPVRWTGARRVDGRGAMAPVLIGAGALGNARDLRVSPQHRMLVTGPRAELLFGEGEVLVAARHLVDGARIRVAPCRTVTYVHLLFDDHEIVWSEGAPSESLHPGAALGERLDADQRAEVLRLFPDLAALGRADRPAARPCLRAWEARALLG